MSGLLTFLALVNTSRCVTADLEDANELDQVVRVAEKNGFKRISRSDIGSLIAPTMASEHWGRLVIYEASVYAGDPGDWITILHELKLRE